MNEYRRNAAGYAAAGGALLGSGAYANHRMDVRLERKGLPQPFRAALERKLSPAHISHVGGRLGVRGLQLTGVPLAAAGVYGLVKPKPNRRLDLKQDVVKPVAHRAVLADAVETGRTHLAKSVVPMSDAEHARQVQRKQRAKRIGLASGTLGVAALGARAPEAAAALARRPGLRSVKGLRRLASHEPKATKASNALGVGAIGVGAIGSFNSARIQGSEAKAEKKVIAKRDDHFLRNYSDRISPDAERGYRYLRSGRNKRAAHAAFSGALAGVSGMATAQAIAQKRYGLAALGGAATVLNAHSAGAHSRDAVRWHGKMDKIRAKGLERASQGVYGRDRNAALNVAKGITALSRPQFGAAMPKGILRKPAIRRGYLMRTASGKTVSVRGSVG